MDKLASKYWVHDPEVVRHFHAADTLEVWTNLELDAQSSFDFLIHLLDQKPNQNQTQALISLLYEGQLDNLLKLFTATRFSSFSKFCEVISKNHILFTTTLLFLVKDLETKDSCLFMDRLHLLHELGLVDKVFSTNNAALIKNLVVKETQKDSKTNNVDTTTTTESGLVLASPLSAHFLRVTQAMCRYPTLNPEALEVNEYLDLVEQIRHKLSAVFEFPNENNPIDPATVMAHLANPLNVNNPVLPVVKKEVSLMDLLLGAPPASSTNPSAKTAIQAENPLNFLFLPFDGQNGGNTVDVEKILSTKENHTEADSYQWVSDEDLHKLDYSDYSKETFNKAKKHVQSIEPCKPRLNVEDLSVFDSLYDELPNFAEVIDFYKGNFILNKSKPAAAGYQVPTPILLIGEPGIGKTHFAKALSQRLKTDNYFLDSNSITASWVLSGSSPTWKEANIGYIFKYLNECKTASPVVIFDEIDKLSSNKSYDPFSTFHQLLEPLNAKKFRDEFLNLTFDASKIVYILSANEFNSIPDSLISRMKVFHIKRPDEAQSRKIAQNMYTQLLDGSQLFKPLLSEENLIALSQYSPREMKQVLMDSIYTQAVKCQHKVENDLFIKSKHEKVKIGF